MRGSYDTLRVPNLSILVHSKDGKITFTNVKPAASPSPVSSVGDVGAGGVMVDVDA